MDLRIKQLKGSPLRDEFKLWHKQTGDKSMWALDIDLALIAKFPRPHIVAILDCKGPRDKLGFSEVLAYNLWLSVGIPVYIVETDLSLKQFTIWRYHEGDYKPNPPQYRTDDIVLDKGTVEQFWTWERTLRQQRAIEIKQTMSR